MIQDRIVIIDLGSKRNTEIARELRKIGIYSEIRPHDLTSDEVAQIAGLRGFVLNAGPNREVDGELIYPSEAILKSSMPILAVGVRGSEDGDMGERGTSLDRQDERETQPKRQPLSTLTDFDSAATLKELGLVKSESPNTIPNLHILPHWQEDKADRLSFLRKFALDICGARAHWNVENFIDDKVAEIQAQVGDGKVLLALSGGVDSSVLAALLTKAIGDRLTCVHVNHGFMRQGESEQVVSVFRKLLGDNLIFVEAEDRFLSKLEGVAEPEKKRKIIGAEFIRIFEEEARKLSGIGFLAQGTIYPDIIESGTKTVKAVKSHHNVGGLPEDMNFALVEPLDMLFKDEVRALGTALGLPEEMVYRQPFPGPGLAVRCPGAITRDRLEAVRHSDAILREEFARAGLDKTVWQYFTVVPPFKSVGVRDGERAFEWPCVLRAVNTIDAMTAEIEELPYDLLAKIT